MRTPPPAYSSIVSQGWTIVEDEKPTQDTVRRWNIREAVLESRMQNVAFVVEQLLPQIQAQAEQGYSKSSLILIPSTEENARGGNLVELDQERPPLIIQFEGSQNTTAFWSQDEVLSELWKQLETALGVSESAETHKTIPTSLQQRPSRSSSWFGRSALREQSARTIIEAPKPPPVAIQVSWEDLHARNENEFGLYETKRAGAVFITLHVK